MSASIPQLFQPVKVGNIELKHRVAMAPLTRYRADAEHVHTDLGVEYYAQRASTPGTLLITEATFIATKAGGYGNVPALETDAQVAAWKKITDAVHEKGSFIYAQLWALGRQADPNTIVKEGFEYIGASDIPLEGKGVAPRPLTTAEVKEFVQLYATAAANAVHRAGFDGVEIHGANGYLVDQFTQDVSNNRTDEYGGSIENRGRFALEVVDAVTKAVGAERTGIRLSPWGDFGGMRMKDPKPQFSYIVENIKKDHPEFAYIHVVEPRVSGNQDRNPTDEESNDFIRDIWAPRPLLSAGGYNREIGLKMAEKGDIAVYGRYFISNPDLPIRLARDIPLTPYNRNTFYTVLSPVGYTDYPFAEIPDEPTDGQSQQGSVFSKVRAWIPFA
ncbi:NADH:flavin oxidoreductase/NADH oxidase [Cristinia sonorae]|uniref:NADH:flavin oxidoreductase/NADH oxidase n=1 Tax=Cristinia sonorae TaxID=1940300 RepID=A0A8K0USH2_9AGAR|nr:NADH:flavin oxidoreductase/NADH oxidase [Cristinia sonorae]